MTFITTASIAITCILIAHLFARATARLAPALVAPARGSHWLLAGAVVALTVLLSHMALGHSWLDALAPRAGIAAHGAQGALAALALSLAALVVLTSALHLLLRRPLDAPPAPSLALLVGVAPDGHALEGVRRPLRWACHALALGLVVALPLTSDTLDPATWALAPTLFVAAARALAPPRSAPPPTPAAAPPPAQTPPDEAAHAALHRALGAPPLFEREPAVAGHPDAFLATVLAAYQAERALAHPHGLALAIAAPPGAGKHRAAERIASELAELGRAALWLRDPAALRSFLDALDHASLSPRLGLVVVGPELGRSGEALALLRYALHRARAATTAPIDLIVLGRSTAVLTVARAIGAAEPRLVTPLHPLPTRPILRYLLAAPPAPELAAAAPAATHFLAFDRPAPLARYPDAASAAREYLVAAGGPRGRRLREDRAHALVRGRAPRLLVALPGDRDAPPARESLAREQLRAALAEAPQDPHRLREVFSPALVAHELDALERAGLLRHLPSWRPSPAGLIAAPRLMARLPGASFAPTARVTLVEPRTARRLEVSPARADFEHYDGAILTLDPGPAAQRYEVRVDPARPAHSCGPDAPRVLTPTAHLAATPLRTLHLRPAASTPATRTRLRFRGPRELELWEGELTLHALHFGVKLFGGHDEASREPLGPESRALTRLLPTPLELAPLTTSARALVLSDASGAALHALTHALRELLPLFVDNASDLGVTWSTSLVPDEPALVFYDAHPDGLGAAADLRADDLEALLTAASALLTCDCAAHCARCCESTTCTAPPAPPGSPLPAPDRHAALRLLTELLVPRPIPLALPTEHPPLRRSA